MKPLSLPLCGLYSYKNPVIVDFQTLTQGGLVGIFGAVGSGKSSLLEAITFVLYGETDRMNKNDQRSYNMMNLRSSAFEVDFRFEKGGEIYRFTASCKRHGKRFGETQTVERGVYRRQADEWVPLEGEAARAENILNLSYRNFRRTVIIPQGKFQEFLELKDSDRLEMLEEIFGLERFNLYGPAARLKTDTDRRAARLEGQLEGLSGVDEGVLDELEKEELVLTRELEGLESTGKSLRTQVEESRRLKEAAEATAQARQRLEAAEAAGTAARERETALGRYEAARRDLLPLERHRADRENVLKVLRKEEEVARGAIQLWEEEDQRFRDEFARVEKEYRERDEIKARAGALLSLAEWLDQGREAGLLKGRLETQDRALRSKEEALVGVESRIRLIQEEREKWQQMLPPRTERQDYQAWITERSRILREKDRLNREKERLAGEKTALETQGRQDFPAEAADRAGLFYTPAGESWFLTNRKEAGEEEERIRQEVDQNRRRESLRAPAAELAAALVDGEPCPVCGSPHHPRPALGDDLPGGMDRQGEESRLMAARALREEAERLHRVWQTGNARALLIREQTARLEKEMALLDEEAASLEARFLWSDYPDQDERAEEIFTLWNQAEEALEKVRESLVLVEAEREDIRRTIDILKDEGTNDRERLAGLEALRKQRREDFPAEIQEEFGIREPEELRTLGAEQLSRAEAVEASWVRMDADDRRLREQGVALKAALAAKEKETVRACLEEEEARRALEAALENSSFQNWQEARDLLSLERDPGEERRIIKEAERELTEARHQVNLWEEKLGNRRFNPEDHQTLEAALAEAEESVSEVRKKLAVLTSRREELKQRLGLKKELEKDLELLEQRRSNIEVLLKLFKGRGFVRHISTLYLRELVDRANVRFENLTRRALRLELSEKNDFLVRDFLNDGRTRSVKTLSGGQTFQAAFSLALALADSVHQAEAGFFFLDEGFGSLDRESLQTVMESLWSLGKEKRIVGVISHVEEMQKEIPTYLMIRRDEGGSRIVPSWEE